MDEIVCTVPEPCDDRDCAYKYHLALYWRHTDGTYTVCDTDGDHLPCEERDVPTPALEMCFWTQYFQYVANTGHDPVHEFVLPDVYASKERVWQARIEHWSGAPRYGLKVTGVRRRGRGPWQTALGAPDTVRDYLLIQENHNCISTFHSFDELHEAGVEINRRSYTEGWLIFAVREYLKPWNHKRVRAWLRRNARLALLHQTEGLGRQRLISGRRALARVEMGCGRRAGRTALAKG